MIGAQREPAGNGLRTSLSRPIPRDRDNVRPVVHLGTIVDDLESPTWQRHKPDAAQGNGNGKNDAATEFTMSDEVEDTYEIPAFLRRNAGNGV